LGITPEVLPSGGEHDADKVAYCLLKLVEPNNPPLSIIWLGLFSPTFATK
jgi:hypothetical protein